MFPTDGLTHAYQMEMLRQAQAFRQEGKSKDGERFSIRLSLSAGSFLISMDLRLQKGCRGSASAALPDAG
jgi:hypothetical protein